MFAVSVTILLLAGSALTLSALPKGWREYRSTVADIAVHVPGDWDVIVDEAAASSEGELHHLVFRQTDDVVWPGWYEIRVLANPDGLDLPGFYSSFDRSDFWDDSAADTTIAGLPAKTWVRWRHDSLTREYLLLNSAGAVHVLHDAHTPNDPDVDEHARVYREITSSIVFVRRDSPTPGRGAGHVTQPLLAELERAFAVHNADISHVTALDLHAFNYDRGPCVLVGWGIIESRSFRGDLNDELFGVFVVNPGLTRIRHTLDILPTPRWRDYLLRIQSVTPDSVVVVGRGVTYGDHRMRRAYKWAPFE